MITLFCPIIINNDFGGGTKSTITLMNGLAKKGTYDIHLMLHPKCEFVDKLDPKINIHWFPTSPIISIKNPFHYYKIARHVANFVNKLDPQTTLYFSTDRPGLMMLPMVRKEYTVFYVSRGWFYINLSAKFIKKFMFPRVNKFICISHKQYDVINEIVHKNEEIEVIYNGFEFEKKTVNVFQNPNQIKLSTIGVICPRKAQLQCLEMMNDLVHKHSITNVLLQIYGTTLIPIDEEYKDMLQNYIQSHNLSTYVTFMGHETDMDKLYHNTDITVSSAMEEGFGRTLIESMSYGVPVIANITAGGPASIITSGIDGFLYDGTTSHLVNQIIQLIENKDLRNQMIENGYQTVATKFSAQGMVDKYDDVITTYFKNN